jgi:hypothetical protein
MSTGYDFSVPQAQRLADLSGIRDDLRAVQQICSYSVSEIKTILSRAAKDTQGHPVELGHLAFMSLSDVEKVVLGALFEAAVIRYFRAFGKAHRKNIPEAWVKSLQSELQETHQYLKDLRDKFIAHSENSFEDTRVLLFLEDGADGPEAVSNITVSEGRTFLGLNNIALGRLQVLVGVLSKMTDEAIKQETESLLAFARTVSTADIRRRPMDYNPPSDQDVGKPRKRFE